MSIPKRPADFDIEALSFKPTITFSMPQGRFVTDPTKDKYELDSDEAQEPPMGPLSLPEGEYQFVYEYPLTNLVIRKHKLTAETTAMDIMKLASQDYRNIYAEEEAHSKVEPKDKQELPGGLILDNRNITDGPHGIWGHTIHALVFVDVHIDPYEQMVQFDVEP